MIKEKIFWEGGSNSGMGGIFYRSDLGQFIKKVEKETGKIVVGIKIEPDSDDKTEYSWNVEIITEKRFGNNANQSD